MGRMCGPQGPQPLEIMEEVAKVMLHKTLQIKRDILTFKQIEKAKLTAVNMVQEYIFIKK